MKRRVFSRMPVHMPVTVQHGSARATAELIDISLGGAFIECTEALYVGQELRIELGSVDDKEGFVAVPARVVHKRRDAWGLSFPPLPQKELARLRTWIFEKTGGRDIVTSVECIDGLQSSAGRFDAAVQELADVIERVFTDGASEEEGPPTVLAAQKAISSAPSENDLSTTLDVFRNPRDEPVGFALVTARRMRHEGRDVAVMRLLAGILPEYRGANLTMGPLIREALRCRTQHPQLSVVLVLQVNEPAVGRLLVSHGATLIHDFRAPEQTEWRALVEKVVGPVELLPGGALVATARVPMHGRALVDDTGQTDAFGQALVHAHESDSRSRAVTVVVRLGVRTLARMGATYAMRQVGKRVAASAAVAPRLARGTSVRTEAYGEWGDNAALHRWLKRLHLGRGVDQREDAGSDHRRR
jgi:hypothetical protein